MAAGRPAAGLVFATSAGEVAAERPEPRRALSESRRLREPRRAARPGARPAGLAARGRRAGDPKRGGRCAGALQRGDPLTARAAGVLRTPLSRTAQFTLPAAQARARLPSDRT